VHRIVHLGTGGSDLGPRLVLDALREQARIEVRFAANIDPLDLARALEGAEPAGTLVVAVSKTFTTAETLANARAAKDWLGGRGRLYAVTANERAAREFGAAEVLPMWDWVGGRFSVWSAASFSALAALGPEAFGEFLAGGNDMDRHFREAPLERNVPALLALLGVWNVNFLGAATHCVLPYAHALRLLPAWLQQLEMESNGKGVDFDGAVLPYDSSAVVWGEPGTNGQHAFFQMLHQGTDVVPLEFIAVRTPSHPHLSLHTKALANCLAQARALMLGKSVDGARGERAPTASDTIDADTLARHRSFPGNRPSTTLVLDALTPRSLGALVALYEHRVFTSGAVWGINSFDQWGVELGKALCNDLLPRFATGDTTGLDPSTAALLRRLR
jgi:glucose-6-phosphate isomerase